MIFLPYKFETELDQYSHNYQPNYFYFISDTFYLDKGYSKCINESIDSVLLKCNFEKRFQNCHIRNKSREVKSLNYFYVYDFIYPTGHQ